MKKARTCVAQIAVLQVIVRAVRQQMASRAPTRHARRQLARRRRGRQAMGVRAAAEEVLSRQGHEAGEAAAMAGGEEDGAEYEPDQRGDDDEAQPDGDDALEGHPLPKLGFDHCRRGAGMAVGAGFRWRWR